MSIIPQAALTTVQIVSGLAASAKNAVDLAKGTSNNELKGALSELYDSVLDVKARVLDLDEEVRSLKTQLAQREEIIGPDEVNGYFCYKSKPEKPLCPKCYQTVPSNAVYLGPMHTFNGGIRRICRVCGFKRMETSANPPQIRMNQPGVWS
ncbi:MAG: hypothetical protein ABR907_07885 [Terracidiphilus sp.]|jgi:hypothetical protein